MKIAVYINNSNIDGVDCSDLSKGNPGIGGTEYCILLMTQIYKQFYSQDEVVIFATKEAKLPKADNVFIVDGINDLSEKVCNKKVDMLVISAVDNGEPLPESFFYAIKKYKIKTITWGHNFYLSDFCTRIAKCEYVKANVFVGRQQYDRYIDHRIIKKSTFIYNMCPPPENVGRTEIKNHSVTYIGSLVPMKGFHVLAQAWKSVLEKVPDATLNVIGSGKLYGRNSKLGKYGIAEEIYENSFIHGLLDDNGGLLRSVKFWGVLGKEKDDVIADTCVGVANPTGRTETFGISAIDFSSRGVPVVTIAKGGFLDTVINGETGLLYSNTGDIADKIAELLNNRDLNKKFGENGRAFSKRFMPEKLIGCWHDLFLRVYENKKIDYIQPDNFMNNNLKWLRLGNRKIKNVLHFEYPLSVIGFETVARNMLRRLGK